MHISEPVQLDLMDFSGGIQEYCDHEKLFIVICYYNCNDHFLHHGFLKVNHCLLSLPIINEDLKPINLFLPIQTIFRYVGLQTKGNCPTIWIFTHQNQNWAVTFICTSIAKIMYHGISNFSNIKSYLYF